MVRLQLRMCYHSSTIVTSSAGGGTPSRALTVASALGVMLALGAAACAWSGMGGALRARPRLHQAHQTANDARLHTLGAVHRAARHAAPVAQEPALLTDDEKVLASLRAAGLGNQTGFTKSNDESSSLDFVFRGHASGARPGSYVAGSIASQCYTGGPAQQACDVAQAPRSLQKSLH